MARLETDDNREWISLHFSRQDAERQLKAVGEAWGVGFTLDGEPADGYQSYLIGKVPLLGPEESGQAPEEDEMSGVPVTKEEYATWTWLCDRDLPGGLSPEEMADDYGITTEVAALRLIALTALGLAREVTPGRYSPGEKDA